MIIVEGPDGAGKTTLIKALQKRFDLPVASRVVSKDTEALLDLQHWVDQNLAIGFQPCIFDRHRLISEPIYGPILRDRAQPGFDNIAWLTPRLRLLYWKVQPIIIYCLPSINTVRNNVTEDDDNKVVYGRIDSIYSAYVAKIAMDRAMSNGPVYLWDYENTPINDESDPWFFHQIDRYLTEKSK